MKNIFHRTVICGFIIVLCGCMPTHGSIKKQELTSDQKKKINKAKEDMKEFPKASAVVANSFYEQGQYFEEQGMEDEALRQYKNALALKPPFSDMIHYTVGLIYYRQDLLEQAAAELQESIALNPDYVYSHFWLGIVAIESEDYQSGIEEMENTLKINPELSDCFYYIGLAYERSQRNFEKAINYYKRYLVYQPQGDKAAAAKKSIRNLEKLLADLHAQQTPDTIAQKAQETPPAQEKKAGPPIAEKTSSPAPAKETAAAVVTPPPAPVSVQAPVEQPAVPPQKIAQEEHAVIASVEPKPVEPSATPVILEEDEEIPARPPAGQKTYTVKANETLWIIAGHTETYDNDSLWPFIFEANKDMLKGKKKLEKGMVLKIPKLDPSIMAKKPAPASKPVKRKPHPKDAKPGDLSRKVTPKQLPAKHTVAAGETLWIIAGYPEYYNDDKKWTLIYEANKEIIKDKKALPAGTVLTIPKMPGTTEKIPAPISAPPAQTTTAGAPASSPMTNIQPSQILNTAGAVASFWAKSTLGAITSTQNGLSTAAANLQNKPAAPVIAPAAVKQEPVPVKPVVKETPVKKAVAAPLLAKTDPVVVTQKAQTAPPVRTVTDQPQKQKTEKETPVIRTTSVTAATDGKQPPQKKIPAKENAETPVAQPAQKTAPATVKTKLILPLMISLPAASQKQAPQNPKIEFPNPLEILFQPKKPQLTLVEQQLQMSKVSEQAAKPAAASKAAVPEGSKTPAAGTTLSKSAKPAPIKQSAVKLPPPVQVTVQKTKEKPAQQKSVKKVTKKAQKKTEPAKTLQKKANDEKVLNVISFGKGAKTTAAAGTTGAKSTGSAPQR